MTDDKLYNEHDETRVTRLRRGTSFATATAEQFGVRPRWHMVLPGEPYPSLADMELDLLQDVARRLHPEDVE